MNTEERWRQRFANFAQAMLKLEQSLAISTPSETERAGQIQFFELAFELAWKTLKDYLESQGHTLSSPRQTLKQGFQDGLLDDGHGWMQALEDRNLTTHTYDEATSIKVAALITETYFPLLRTLETKLRTEL